MSLNSNLHKASKAKKDEFYTQLSDIEQELKYYKKQFKGKVVYCNCDDPFESNFFRFFALNFKQLGLKRLITTSYKPSTLANTQLGLYGDDKTITPLKGRPKVTANKFIINEVGDIDGDGAFTLKDISEQLKANVHNEWAPLKGTGDFRSDECIELLNEVDIVVTNPPFSLFREYIAQLLEFKKKFLIIGNQNAITYKEVFKYIKDNKIWLGHGHPKKFRVPDNYENGIKDDSGVNWQTLGNICWFTNLDVSQRHERLTLYKKYNDEDYPKYDNYDAIEVSKVSEIPQDYEGVMGVPITFLDKYNPEQFEILGITDREPNTKYRTKMYSREDSIKYNDLNRRAAIKVNGAFKPVYARLLIKSKQDDN